MAVALPALVVVLAGALAVLSALAAQLHCVDAARLGARAAARGDSEQQVRRVVEQGAPGATVEVGRGQGLVHVRVSLSVAAPADIAPLRVSASATAAEEALALAGASGAAAGSEPAPAAEPP